MLLFITARNRDRLCYWVSIHLMLLFIFRLPCVTSPLKRVSIHLMLLFIRRFAGNHDLCTVVSIHLMLLFIVLLQKDKYRRIRVSIHLMLLFILLEYMEEWNRRVFQYISCYSLSVGKKMLNGSIKCFNTSHVTLYHSPIISKSLFSKCFNTSHVTLYRRLQKKL